jgi:SAM-dependent methyltransferase
LSESHWSEYYRRWSRLTPPLRPNEEVRDCIRGIIADHDQRVLLLGVTPELVDIGDELIGVDHSATMIAHIWPGDTERRRVVKGEWLALDFPPGHFSAAVGDGCLSVLTFPAGYQTLCGQLARVVRPGGKLVFRMFRTPEIGEPVAAVCHRAMKGQIRSFHAFKWHLAMAIVAEAGDPNIRVERIREVFNEAFPDRASLARAAGWREEDIATIDVYKGSWDVYSFPTWEQFRRAIPDALTNLQFISAGSYELAERCPLVTMNVAGSGAGGLTP